jgi:hypothetical protein
MRFIFYLYIITFLKGGNHSFSQKEEKLKFVKFHHKPVSMLVLVAFAIMLCFWANQTPAAPTTAAAEKSSVQPSGNGENEGTGFIETEESAPAVKRGKKFPWLIAALVVVAGGAAVYFLVLKKKNCTLTVNVGEGVTGTPATGTSVDKKGTVIHYSYSLQSGYGDLAVTLDGAPVAASGTVTLNANHTLAANASKTFTLTVNRGEYVVGNPSSGTYPFTQGTSVPYNYAPASGYSNLEVKVDNAPAAAAGAIVMNSDHTLTASLYGANIVINSTPAGAHIYMDNANSGFTTPHAFYYPAAVTKAVLLRHSCPYKDYTQAVSVTAGQTKTVNATLEFGIKEDFDIPASTCWITAYYPGVWSSGGGVYKCQGTAPNWIPNPYSYFFSGDYTLYVKMNRKSGPLNTANGVILSTTTNCQTVSGYLFYYFPSGTTYQIYRLTNYNLITNSGAISLIANGTSAAIKPGLNKWNLLKIIRSGNNYSFRVNTGLVTSFTDATHNPGYCILAPMSHGANIQVLYEYVYMNMGSGSGSVPGQPARTLPVNSEEIPLGILPPGK